MNKCHETPQYLERLRMIAEQQAKVEECGRMMAKIFDTCLMLYGPEVVAGAALSYVGDVIRQKQMAKPDPNWTFLEATITTFRTCVKEGADSATVFQSEAGG